MTPRTEPMPFEIPGWLKDAVLREQSITSPGTHVWRGIPHQITIARLLWERGEPEPVDPDVEAMKRILNAFHDGSFTGSFETALAAYKAEKART